MTPRERSLYGRTVVWTRGLMEVGCGFLKASRRPVWARAQVYALQTSVRSKQRLRECGTDRLTSNVYLDGDGKDDYI